VPPRALATAGEADIDSGTLKGFRTSRALAPAGEARLRQRDRQRDREPVGWFQRLYARRTLLLATPALGAAAAALIFTRGRGGAPLPAYTMSLTGGVASLRGDAPAGAEPLQLAEGSRVELRLRPEHPVAAGGVEVQLYWSRAGQQVRWTATTEISDQGAVRVIGPAPRPLGAGDGELVVLIGRPGSSRQTLRTPVRWR
jgi:hypothetical protein